MSWIDKFVSEKELDTDHIFEVEGDSGPNFIALAVVIEHVKIATKQEQAQIKNVLVKIDFVNGDVMHFFNHLAQASQSSNRPTPARPPVCRQAGVRLACVYTQAGHAGAGIAIKGESNVQIQGHDRIGEGSPQGTQS